MNKNDFTKQKNRDKAAYKLKIQYKPGNKFYQAQQSGKCRWQVFHGYNSKPEAHSLASLKALVDARRQFIQAALLYDNQTDQLITQLV